jgi:hypothetical protein
MTSWIPLVGALILLVFAYWDYTKAILPNREVLLSTVAFFLVLLSQPVAIILPFIIFEALAILLWGIYGQYHQMSCADSILLGLFAFCSLFFSLIPMVLFGVIVALCYFTDINTHYIDLEDGSKKRLVKMIPPMFLSLLLGIVGQILGVI